MRPTIARARRVLAGVFLLTATFTAHPALADSAPSATRAIPKTWDETLLRTQHVPLADARIKVTHLSEQSYYAMPERVLYKSYPIYHPEHEPPGYLASLEQKEPEILRFDTARFKTEREWIEFGREVFQSPTGSDSEAFAALITRARSALVRDRALGEADDALAKYVYSLTPPANPHRPRTEAQRTQVARGKTVFERLNCGLCHRPPLYTNNRLTPVIGFEVPSAHLTAYAITELALGTDPGLSLETRRGTGYYKVPSLLGVWYRGPFEHNGSIATLEDWFDPRRLADDYVPTGWKGPPGTQTRAVRGHTCGLNLPAADREALIAFLRTL